MFDGAKLKVQRADYHISYLKEIVEKFVSSQPYVISIDGNPQGSVSVGIKLTKDIPVEFPLIIGDAIHNLRTALDHATWELIGLDSGTQDRWTKLPASATGKVDYEAACRGMKTPRDDTKQFFIDLAIYDGASSPLYAVHLLDNTDKHMIMLPTVAAASISKIRFVTPQGNTAIQMSHSKLAVGPSGTARLAQVPQGLTLVLDDDSEVSASIFFAPDQPFAGQPVIPTLEALAKEASAAISAFESFVANRA